MEAPRGASPTVSNYRGVTASRQQQFALRNPSYPSLGSALPPPSPHFAAAYRTRSPSRPAISSHQSNPQLRTRPVANRTRPNSAILLSTSRNATVEQNASAMAAGGHHGQTQERPVSLHAALPSTVDRAMMDSVHRQEEVPLEIPRKSSQRPKPSQKPKRPSRPTPQRAPSPEQKEPQGQVAQKAPSPEQQSLRPISQRAPSPKQKEPQGQMAQKAPSPEQQPSRPVPQRAPSPEQKKPRGQMAQKAASPEQEQLTTQMAQRASSPEQGKPPSQMAQKAQITEQPRYQLPSMWFEQPSRERIPERPQYRDQSTQTEAVAPRDLCPDCHCHQKPPTRQIPQPISETPERTHHQQASRQTIERAQIPEHDRIPQPRAQTPEHHRQEKLPPKQPPQQKAQTPEHHRQEKLPSKQTPQQKAQTPEPSHRQRSSTPTVPRDQTPAEPVESQHPHKHVIAPTPDRSALLNRRQVMSMQPPRRVSQLPDQPSPWNDHQQPQQSPTASAGLAGVFRNSATPTSPHHSRHGSLNSVMSDHSSQSRHLPAFSPASSTLDVKDTYSRNHGEDHVSSPLAMQWEKPDSSSRPNSVICDSPAEEDFPKGPKKPVKKERRSSGFQRLISIGSMEKLGMYPDEKDTGKTTPDQKASDEDSKLRQNGRHSFYGPSTFSHSVDNLSASSVFQKVGNKMKRKSQGLSGLLRPKAGAVSGSSLTDDRQHPRPMAAPEKQKSPILGTVNSKTNLSRDDIYLFTNTSEPLLNLNKDRKSVQEPDIMPTPQTAAPRGILNHRTASSSYPTADLSGTEEAEFISSPASTAPITPSGEVQYIFGHSVNPFETTDIETLMDVFSLASSVSNHKVTSPQSILSPAGVSSTR